MRRRSPSGFTLLEVLAAISILGLAISAAVALLDQLNDAAERIARESGRSAREANGARLLARLLMDARTSVDTAERFRGDSNSAELWTLCDVPGGWAERCRVTLSLDQRSDSSAVLIGLPGATPISGRRQPGRATFRYYYPSTRSDTLWAPVWSSNASLPVAIGVFIGADTIVLPVGPARD
jgi:prepilin-type N-terminal cleavage/methylation domain-containing protein